MSGRAKYWGWVGAAAGLGFCLALLCASQSPLHGQVRDLWLAVTYPVTEAWLALFRTLEGDRGMMFILPMLASQVLYVVALGFAAGALLSKPLRALRGEPAAAPNVGPAASSASSEARKGPPSVI